jgi:energy-coupling factor transporter ATP-binding protein EcfA2
VINHLGDEVMKVFRFNKERKMELLIPQTESDEGFKFTINPGERALLLGPNGAGKSRLGAYIESELSKYIVQSGAINSGADTTDQISQKQQELVSIESMPGEFFATKIKDHQNSPVHAFIPSSLTRKDILKLYFERELDHLEIVFNSNTDIKSIPSKSLDEISGGSITINGVRIDVELMKVNSESNESILKFKNDRISKIKKEIADLNLENIGYIKINKEESDNEKSIQYCLRISGHRSLIFNQTLSIVDSEVAIKNLHGDTSNINQKWHGKPTGGLQADFEKLLIALISEEVNASLTFKQSSDSAAKPVTKLDDVIKF